MTTSQGRMTLEEFLRLPEEKPALEFFDGVVTQKIPRGGRHSVLRVALLQRCNEAGGPRKLYRALPELRTTFGGQSLVPDISVYCWDRVPRTGTGVILDDFYVPPDVAIEITSPGQSVGDLMRRSRWYVANGVLIALIVAVEQRSVHLFRSGTAALTFRGRDQIDLSDVLPEIRFTIEELFASLKL